MEAPAESPAPAARSPGGLPVPSRRLLVLFAGIAVLSVIFWFGRDILAPFVVGILIVYLLDPLVERLARIKTSFRTATGRKYGPQFIDLGIAIGEELYRVITAEFASEV